MINQTLKCVLLILALLATGCQSGYRDATKASMNQYISGDYPLAASTAIKASEANRKSKKNRVTYNLESGRMAQVAGDYEGSEKYYGLAYEDVRPFLDEKAENKITEAIVTTVINQTLSEYRATPGERIMLNTLRALNDMATGDLASARVELRRAKHWQQDARDRYSKQIEKAGAAVEEEMRKKNVYGVDQESHVAKFMTSYKGYGDYQNPFTDHLHAILSIAQHGRQARSDALDDLNDISQSNAALQDQIASDISFLSSSSERSEASPTTWIYFMTGIAPSLKENKIRIPVPVQGIDYIVAAFPELVIHDDHIAGISTRTAQGVRSSSELVSMDRILGNEFNVRLPLIIKQEIATAIIKTIAAKAAQEENKGLGMFLLTTIAKDVSTSADLRSWHSLPKQIQLSRISTPDDGLIDITGSAHSFEVQVEVTPNKHNIVVITMPSTESIHPSVISATLN